MQRLSGCQGWVGAGAVCWMGGWVLGPPQPPCCKGKWGSELCRGSRHTPVVVCGGPLSSVPCTLPTHKVRVVSLRSPAEDEPLGDPKGFPEAWAVRPVVEAPLGPTGEEGSQLHHEKHGPTEGNLGLTTCFSEPISAERRALHPKKRPPSSDVRSPSHPAGAVILWSFGA